MEVFSFPFALFPFSFIGYHVCFDLFCCVLDWLVNVSLCYWTHIDQVAISVILDKYFHAMTVESKIGKFYGHFQP